MSLHPTTLAVHGIAAMVAAEHGLTLDDVLHPVGMTARDKARAEIIKRAAAAGIGTDSISEAIDAPRDQVLIATRNSFAVVIERVSRETGIAVAAIKGKSRKQQVVHARQRVMFLMREQGWSYPRIGWQLNRDHTTIMHGVQAERARMAAQ